MRFSCASPDGAQGGTPSKKKRPYTRLKVKVLTLDQAEAEVKSKAAAESQDFKDCSELIAEARKRQEHGRN